MIIDNTEEKDTSIKTLTNPLYVYLKDLYSLYGNIIIEKNSDHLRCIIELPNISLDGGILFQNLFLEKLERVLNKVSNFNYYVENHNIKYNLLVKEHEDSLIVNPTVNIACFIQEPTYSKNNTYKFTAIIKYISNQEYPITLPNIIQDMFNQSTNQFRKQIYTFK